MGIAWDLNIRLGLEHKWALWGSLKISLVIEIIISLEKGRWILIKVAVDLLRITGISPVSLILKEVRIGEFEILLVMRVFIFKLYRLTVCLKEEGGLLQTSKRNQ